MFSWHLYQSINLKVGCVLLYAWLHYIIRRKIIVVIGCNKVRLICIQLVAQFQLCAKKGLILSSIETTNQSFYCYYYEKEVIKQVKYNTVIMCSNLHTPDYAISMILDDCKWRWYILYVYKCPKTSKIINTFDCLKETMYQFAQQ